MGSITTDIIDTITDTTRTTDIEDISPKSPTLVLSSPVPLNLVSTIAIDTTAQDTTDVPEGTEEEDTTTAPDITEHLAMRKNDSAAHLNLDHSPALLSMANLFKSFNP